MQDAEGRFDDEELLPLNIIDECDVNLEVVVEKRRRDKT